MKWDSRLTDLRASMDTSEVDYSKPYWKLIAAWCNYNGSWDNAPQWAWEYISDHAGGDHHAYGLALKKDGSRFLEPRFVLQWPGGAHAADGRPEWDGYGNAVLGPSGYPWKDTPGPYIWYKGPSTVAPGGCEKLAGIGLPYPPLPWEAEADASAEGGCHVSWFCVWQLTDPQVVPPPPPPPPPPPSEWTEYDAVLGPFSFVLRLRKRV